MELLLVVAVPMAVFAFLAPGMAMVAARSPVRYSPYAYPLSLVTCVLWCAYGAKYNLVPLYRLSAGGAALQLIYLGLFLCRAPADDDRRGWTFRLLLLAALMDTFREVEYGAYGWVCCVVASFAAASPFMNQPAVEDMRQTRTMRRMPPWIVPAPALPNAILWMIRNWPNDNSLVLLIAGFVTALVSLLLLVLHLACWMMTQPAPAPGDDELHLHEPLIVNGHQQAADPPPNDQVPAVLDGIIVEDPAAPQEIHGDQQEEPLIVNGHQQAADPPPNNQVPALVDEDPVVPQGIHVVQQEEEKDKVEIEVEPEELEQQVGSPASRQQINVQTDELKDNVEKKEIKVQTDEPKEYMVEKEEDAAPKPINDETDDDPKV